MGIRLYKYGPVVACGIEKGILIVEDNFMHSVDLGIPGMSIPMQRIAVDSHTIRAALIADNGTLVIIREDNTINTYDGKYGNLLGGKLVKGMSYDEYTCNITKEMSAGFLLNYNNSRETAAKLNICSVKGVDGLHLFADGSGRCALHLDENSFLLQFCKTNWNPVYPNIGSSAEGSMSVDYGEQGLCYKGVEAKVIYAGPKRRF